MCISAFSTTDSSLYRGGGGVEWVGTLRGGQVERWGRRGGGLNGRSHWVARV